MRKRYILLAILFFWLPTASAESFIQKHIPNAQQVSSARYSVFMFDVYDASFYTATGNAEIGVPFALKLSYLRSFKGEDIAARSAEEMRDHQGIDEVTLAGWHEQMRKIFPDVEKGDSITGIYPDGSACIFYKNSSLIGQVTGARFCKAFFDIWFGTNTSAPKLRKQLLSKKEQPNRKSN